MARRQNYSDLFKLFEHDRPDRKGTILQKIGKNSFTASIFAGGLSVFIKDETSTIYNIAIAVFCIGFLVGLSMFLATGIHYAGREKGKTNFSSSAAHMLKNTFLYVLLPCLVVTLIVVIWAILTKQPAFTLN